MKRFGIVLGIFVLIGGLAGAWAASRYVLVRSSWQQKTTKAKADVLAKRKQLAELDKLVTTLKQEQQRLIHGWERYWASAQVDRGAQPSTLTVGLGTAQGIKQNDIVYVFQPAAEGAGTAYVGPFKVTAVQETRAALAPSWRTRGGEENSWRYGANWRVRTNIPVQHKSNFSNAERNLLVKDELLIAQQKHLEIQQEAKTRADENLQLRLKELSGGQELPAGVKPESLEPYLVEGYHKAVTDVEVQRDAVQADVDELRRQLKRTRDEINRLIQENERLAKEAAGDAPKAAQAR